MALTFLLILALAFVLAFLSMKDFDVPGEIKKMISARKMKGTIILTKKKAIHYSSDSSVFSSWSKGR
ncbi:MAG: hypothetical protein Q7U68_02090 [Candidatus Roizmanbacteria bacterium]|nr:hypothetical protein [Candidatus Roizmanbacteria bacterium]